MRSALDMLMSPPSTTDILNRLLVLHDAVAADVSAATPRPIELAGNEQAKAVLGQIVADQKRTVDRLGDADPRQRRHGRSRRVPDVVHRRCTICRSTTCSSC